MIARPKLFRPTLLCIALILIAPSTATRAQEAATENAEVLKKEANWKKLLSDDFERQEAKESEEDVGGGWQTNSQSRAKGKKQADLADGALRIKRAKVADHGVSVVHDVDFRDAIVTLRFKIDKGDELGLNFADMKEKSVHAGHICVAKIRVNRCDLTDLKTGSMDLEVRKRRVAGKATAADKQLSKEKFSRFEIDLTPNEWHVAAVKIQGDLMQIAIDGELVGEFRSAGIAHPTKSRLRLAVLKNAWVDDIEIWGN